MAKSQMSPSRDTAPPERPHPAVSQRLRPAPQSSGHPHSASRLPVAAVPHPRCSPAPPLQPPRQPEPRPAQPSALRRTHTLELAAAFHDPHSRARARTQPHPLAHAPQPGLRPLCWPDPPPGSWGILPLIRPPQHLGSLHPGRRAYPPAERPALSRHSRRRLRG